MKRIFTPLTSLALLTFILTGCIKENPVVDDNDIIGTWMVTDIRSNIAYDWDGDGRSETDIYNTYSYCQQDIALVFDYDGYGQSRQGCNASWQSMYWQFTNDHTLNMDMHGDELNLDITQFTRNTIRGDDQVYVNGRNYIISYTLSRR